MAFVYVSIPSRTKGYWDTFTGLLLAMNVAAQKGIFCSLEPHIGSSLICRARQNMTYKFLYENTKCDYFLQLDDDVVIPPTGIVDLVEADKNVVGGMYSLKSKKAGKIALRALGDKVIDITKHPNEVMEVRYLSTGCFMQKREVVQKAWDHYSDRAYIANPESKNKGGGLDRRALYTPFIYDDEYLSEDWAYCQRLRDIGEKIWLHTNVKCVHWGLAPYGIK